MPDERVTIRPARQQDAPSIAAVAGQVWPEEPLDPATIARLIAETERSTAVAELTGVIVGFVDGFATETLHGTARWEVDLLAVGPGAQGLGIGRRLVASSVAAGVAAGATSARGLIRSGNVASERVFHACGFLADDFVSRLWIAEGLAAEPGGEPGCIIPVVTFRYQGVWLEEVTADRLRSLRRAVRASLVGAVIPLDDAGAIRAATQAGMQPDGEFRFWRRVLA